MLDKFHVTDEVTQRSIKLSVNAKRKVSKHNKGQHQRNTFQNNWQSTLILLSVKSANWNSSLP